MIGTPMGAELVLHEAPPHLGRGVVLELRMHNIFDPRRAEVFLDQESMEEVYVALKAHRERLRAHSG